jgi:cobalamin biosynthesis protein CobT
MATSLAMIPDTGDDDDQDDDTDDSPKSRKTPTAQGQDDKPQDRGRRQPRTIADDSAQAAQAQVSMDELADQEMGEDTDLPDGEAPLEPPAPQPISDADPNYTVYNTDFDEEILAEELADPIELERLRAYLDQQLEPLKGAVAGWPTSCNAACRRSRTARGCSIWKKGFWTQAAWRGLWPTPQRRCRSRSKKTPNSAIRW